jgi:multidrug efflux pump subunit AcrA (membrane-fusion protein)
MSGASPSFSKPTVEERPKQTAIPEIRTSVTAGEQVKIVPQHDAANAGLQLILQIERDARRIKTTAELGFLIVNDTRRAVGARQVFLLQPQGKKLQVSAVSSLSAVERHAPVIQWIEQRLSRIMADKPAAPVLRLNLKTDSPDEDVAKAFPFPEGLITPIVEPRGRQLGLLLSVRETPFSENDGMIQQRLAETYGHAWGALGGLRASLGSKLRKPGFWVGVCVLTGLTGMLPIPMTALAPAEVVPLEAIIIAAPIDGSIDQILVDPNHAVKAGDILFRYVDTQARGALDVADREVTVAEAKLRQASQMAFVDPAAKRELAVARTELRLKQAEQSFAAEVFERTVIRAPRPGIAVYADKRELIGRPVSIGQRIMELADPAQTQFRLQVPADDALVLREGAKVRIFMDSDPLNPLSGSVTRASPMARAGDSGSLVFKTEAKVGNGEIMPPLGHRGTAQISGERVSLAFYLLRRPIAGLRQRTGL